MKAWRGEGDFLALLKADAEVRKHLSEKELAANFDLDFHLAQVDTIFRRVFGRGNHISAPDSPSWDSVALPD